MSMKKVMLLVAVLLAAAFVLSACAGPAGSIGPAGPAGPVGPTGPAGAAGTNPKAADLACTACHNDTTLIAGKMYAWQTSRHGTVNEDWLVEGSQQTCSGCHSGAGFIARMAAGQNFLDWGAAKVTTPDATPQTCRTCHTIHTTYTKDDFALRSTTAVALVKGGTTFDKGKGNLCANCHQARRYMADFPVKDAAGNVVAGMYAASSRFNPHLSGQSDVLMGVGGGTVAGTPGAHYTITTDSCVTCHLGDAKNHTFKGQISVCVTCHADAKADANGRIDVNYDAAKSGAVARIQAKFDTLKAGLTKLGLVDANGSAVTAPAAGYDEAHAWPLWVYGYIMEDGSMGVHNPKYINALLDAAIAGLPAK
jgi:hypothetical protein